MKRLTWVITLTALMLVLALPVLGQTATPTLLPTPAPGSVVMVVGPVEFVDGDIMVNGYIIAPANAFQPAILTEGQVVIIIGLLLPDGVTIQATEFEYFEDAAETPTPTPTFTPSPTPDPRTPTVTPTATPTANVVTVTPTIVVVTVTPPVRTTAIAEPSGRTPACSGLWCELQEIMGWHCAGFGFGEIARAYLLAEETGVVPATYFALKSGGQGWGQNRPGRRYQWLRTPFACARSGEAPRR